MFDYEKFLNVLCNNNDYLSFYKSEDGEKIPQYGHGNEVAKFIFEEPKARHKMAGRTLNNAVRRVARQITIYLVVEGGKSHKNSCAYDLKRAEDELIKHGFRKEKI